MKKKKRSKERGSKSNDEKTCLGAHFFRLVDGRRRSKSLFFLSCSFSLSQPSATHIKRHHDIAPRVDPMPRAAHPQAPAARVAAAKAGRCCLVVAGRCSDIAAPSPRRRHRHRRGPLHLLYRRSHGVRLVGFSRFRGWKREERDQKVTSTKRDESRRRTMPSSSHRRRFARCVSFFFPTSSKKQNSNQRRLPLRRPPLRHLLARLGPRLRPLPVPEVAPRRFPRRGRKPRRPGRPDLGRGRPRRLRRAPERVRVRPGRAAVVRGDAEAAGEARAAGEDGCGGDGGDGAAREGVRRRPRGRGAGGERRERRRWDERGHRCCRRSSSECSTGSSGSGQLAFRPGARGPQAHARRADRGPRGERGRRRRRRRWHQQQRRRGQRRGRGGSSTRKRRRGRKRLSVAPCVPPAAEGVSLADECFREARGLRREAPGQLVGERKRLGEFCFFFRFVFFFDKEKKLNFEKKTHFLFLHIPHTKHHLRDASSTRSGGSGPASPTPSSLGRSSSSSCCSSLPLPRRLLRPPQRAPGAPAPAAARSVPRASCTRPIAIRP